MKLFGGGSQHNHEHPKRESSEPQYQDEYTGVPPYEDDLDEIAPRPEGIDFDGVKQKKPLTPRQLRNRILLVVVMVLLAIIMVTCAAAAMMMKPPSIADTVNTVRPEKNDSTINDTENGDEMVLDEGDAIDIDMGNRREGVYTVLVAATDIDQTRTDALMVATLDTKEDTVDVVNIPRDLMSNCNRIGAAKKINAAYGTRGGIETTKSEVKKVIGFTPDKFVVVSFQGIADIIDALGGVTYEVPWRMKYDDPTQNLHIDFQPGETEMDGQAAVEFMRWRKNNSGVSTGVKGTTGGDEERIEKDQKFLKFLASEVFQVKNMTRIPSLAQAVFKNVETDLTAGEVLWLAWQLYDVKNENINMMTLPGYGQMSYAGTGDMYSFYFPYRSQVLEMVNEYLNPYEKAITSIDVVGGPTGGGGSGSSGKGKSGSSKATKDEDDEEEEASTSENGTESGLESTGGSTDPEGGVDATGGEAASEGSEDPEDPNNAEGLDGENETSGSDPESGESASGSEGETGSNEGGNGSESTTAPSDQGQQEALEPVIPDGIFAPGVTPDPPAA